MTFRLDCMWAVRFQLRVVFCWRRLNQEVRFPFPAVSSCIVTRAMDTCQRNKQPIAHERAYSLRHHRANLDYIHINHIRSHHIGCAYLRLRTVAVAAPHDSRTSSEVTPWPRRGMILKTKSPGSYSPDNPRQFTSCHR